MRRYQSDVRGTFARLCNGDMALADDLSQEVFIKLYKYLPSFKGNSQFKTWLYRICINTFLNEKKKRAVEFFSDDEQHEPATVSSEQQLNANKDINAAFAQLKSQQKLMLELNMIKGFSHQEIVDITGLPTGTVKSHIQRGKVQLQQLLQDWAEN